MESIQIYYKKYREKYLAPVIFFVHENYTRRVVEGKYTRWDLAALFVVAISIGLGTKMLFVEHVTMGFEDYTLHSYADSARYDMNVLQEQESQKSSAPQTNALVGRMCEEPIR